ncbi:MULTISPECIES: sensor histidine kinase [Streptococcus]|nr:sensor histidine kinase [Streptococcus parauberis]KYP20764.1 Sensor histidine kinase YehU [Streptococcus parauberis]KYP22508.1 Sensor histidine kinase YehU [Streptococcus parauberis]KYP22603.1 Sensor histidine kinase YehU [Streptococcus parauberis]KYP28887.1 Sensor histidine kinase YehU [Streptococcus parauberis]KYP29034.1 Sensor histidine kinase YehU [Streptococcus parauberis]
MLSLFLPLLERVGLIILLANLLMISPFYKKMMYERDKPQVRWVLIITFSIFAIISNFTGVLVSSSANSGIGGLVALPAHNSIANTRTLTIGMSGLIGGPFVGIFVGLISGTVRLLQGGTAPYTYFISSLLIGLFSGLVGQVSLKKKTYPEIWQGSLCGALMEVIQMLCIFIFHPDKAQALALIHTITLPMLVVNALGTGIFLSIILGTLKQEESMKAIQTHDVLELANTTLPFFRQGLTLESAEQAAKVIMKYMRVSAVSITNRQSILAHVGLASDHHIPTKKIITDLSKEVIETGKIHIVRSKNEIGCHYPDCPLAAAIVVPLYVKGKVAGTFKLYFSDPDDLTYVEEQLANGLGDIFSSQLELGQMALEQGLLKDAEIKSLQAQVNPHFLFNAINTISALMRIDSEKARYLLLQLGQYFRSNITSTRKNVITVEEELNHLNAYLTIEQARFPNRYQVDINMPDSLKKASIPPFIIQILVENALKHAFPGRKANNKVWVKLTQMTANILELEVKDNGEGIAKELLSRLGREIVPSNRGTGSALENLNRRLISLYGTSAHLQIDSSKEGASFKVLIPLKLIEEEQ